MSTENPVDVTDAQASEGAESTDQPDRESAPQESQPDAAEAEVKSEKSKGGFQSRIDKLTRDRWDAHQARQAAEQRASELEQRLQQLSQPGQKPNDDGPKESDYTDWMQYQHALVEHASARQVEKALTAQRQADAHRSQREQQQSHVREFIVRAENLAAELPDFNQAAGGINLDGPVGAALLQSEQGAAVAYYLGSNPADLMRIESIRDPVRAAIEIGRLESKATQFAQSRSRSKAPAQGAPLATGSGAGDSGPSERDSVAEYIRKRSEKRHRTLKRG